MVKSYFRCACYNFSFTDDIKREQNGADSLKQGKDRAGKEKTKLTPFAVSTDCHFSWEILTDISATNSFTTLVII